MDLLCGDGRDSELFAKNGHSVIGVDWFAPKNELGKTPFYIKNDIDFFIRNWPPLDVIYARFALHAVKPGLRKRIVNWMKGSKLILVESREGNEVPDDTHDRWPYKGTWLVHALEKMGFTVTLEIGRGLAKTDNEDPLIHRVIAWKN